MTLLDQALRVLSTSLLDLLIISLRRGILAKNSAFGSGTHRLGSFLSSEAKEKRS
jgi:hypothetical protein